MRNRIIEQHYRENAERLTKTVRYRVGGSHALAEDVVSEAYARALRYWSSFVKGDKGFDPWFRGILNNTCRSLQDKERSQGAITETDYKESIMAISAPDHLQVASNIIKDEVRGIVKERDKNIVHLYYNLQYSAKDIKDVVEGTTIGSIKMVLKRFKEMVVSKHGD